jgi:hypothetical protein
MSTSARISYNSKFLDIDHRANEPACNLASYLDRWLDGVDCGLASWVASSLAGLMLTMMRARTKMKMITIYDESRRLLANDA